MLFALTIDPARDANAAFSALLKLSATTSLLRPDGTVAVSGLEQLPFAQSWPFPYQRDWVLVGNTGLADGAPTEWFEESQRPDLVTSECSHQSHEWIAVSYFTTYQSNYLVFATRDRARYQLLKSQLQAAVVEEYEDITLGGFRNLTFTHQTGDERQPSLTFARSRGEIPLLLCQFEHQQDYGRWDEDFERYDPTPWHSQLLGRLEEVQAWRVKRSISYGVYSVTDEQAYAQLWSKTGSDNAVAVATFAADSDLERLKALTRDSQVGVEHFQRQCPWLCRLVYGGGSDEYHAHLRAQDCRATEIYRQLVKDSVMSRF